MPEIRKTQMGDVIWRTDDKIELLVANKKTLLSEIWKKGLIVPAYLGGF